MNVFNRFLWLSSNTPPPLSLALSQCLSLPLSLSRFLSSSLSLSFPLFLSISFVSSLLLSLSFVSSLLLSLSLFRFLSFSLFLFDSHSLSSYLFLFLPVSLSTSTSLPDFSCTFIQDVERRNRTIGAKERKAKWCLFKWHPCLCSFICLSACVYLSVYPCLSLSLSLFRFRLFRSLTKRRARREDMKITKGWK